MLNIKYLIYGYVHIQAKYMRKNNDPFRLLIGLSTIYFNKSHFIIQLLCFESYLQNKNVLVEVFLR